MTEYNTEYVLTLEDLPNMHMLMHLQNRLGSGTARTSSDDTPEYFRCMMNLGWLYPKVKNAKLKSLYDALFTTLKPVTNQAQMTLVSQYYDYCQRSAIAPPPTDQPMFSGCSAESYPWRNYWYTFRHGFCYSWRCDDQADQYQTNQYWPGVLLPDHTEWRAQLQAVLTSWGDTPPTTYIELGAKLEDKTVPATSSKTKLDTWSGENQMPAKAIAPFETAVNGIITSILKETSLSPDSYFFLLHLIIGLATSNTVDHQRATKIVKCITSSNEYPNDAFINQLMYMILMILIDPIGTYRFNHDQLKAAMNDLLSAITSTDETSKMIIQSIQNSLAILNADPSYPMQDPYNPSIGFNTRKADTLEALDGARKSLST
ncbi:MAG TPA: hypothetical protein VFG10_16135 [Saprospiraceae bacterium]|nr:hypothetical protein [Saprospiraceae bacterium]